MKFLLSLAMEGQEHIIEHIVYTRDQLIVLCEPALLPGARPEVPKELRSRSKTEGEEEETQTGCTSNCHGEREVSGE